MQTEKQRERLVELLLKCDKESEVLDCFNERPKKTQSAELIADYLIANNVVVLPCKVGQVLWFPSEYYNKPYSIFITKAEIYEEETIMYSEGGCEWYEEDIGKTVFLSREEAEAKLKEMQK